MYARGVSGALSKASASEVCRDARICAAGGVTADRDEQTDCVTSFSGGSTAENGHQKSKNKARQGDNMKCHEVIAREEIV